MAIQGIIDLPAALQGIIQRNFLEKRFRQGLDSILGYEAIADQESFAVNIGETITKTRSGRLTPIEAPLDPSTNTNFDNGLTPSEYAFEQYTLPINEYADTMDLNLVGNEVIIADKFLQNALNQGIQARQSLCRLSRNALFNTYMGGNTWVRVTLGAAAVTIEVDDVRKFNEIVVDGQVVTVSASNSRPVTVGANVYSLTGVAEDIVNVSSVANTGGISGSLTFATNVSIADGTAGNPVVAAYAPVVLRPEGRPTTLDLTSTDFLTMSLIQDAVDVLRSNAVPTINGFYNFFLDNKTMKGLYRDEEFQLLYRGNPQRLEYVKGVVAELMDVRFIVLTETFQQTLPSGVRVKRPILCGQGALIRGNFAGHDVRLGMRSKNIVFRKMDEVLMSVRSPLDRLGEIVAQSWSWIGGFAVPTDVTATTAIIPTANDSYYKRATMLECV